ncbi:MAG: hypothetical protein NVSMB31_06070 [Vulcanimicrobiaceae bacterium]
MKGEAGVENPCDQEATRRVRRLFEIAPDHRDDQWIADFFGAIPKACIAGGLGPSLINGPDGFPYAAIMIPQDNAEVEAFSMAHVLQAGTDGGYGIAINPSDRGVDWVFSYGDLFAYRAFGEFNPKPWGDRSLKPGDVTLEKDTKVLIGAPSEDVLPLYARAALRNFFERTLGIAKSAVAVVQLPDAMPEFAFTIDRRACATEKQFSDMMTGITWFLPRSYSVMAPPPEWLDGAMRDVFDLL